MSKLSKEELLEELGRLEYYLYEMGQKHYSKITEQAKEMIQKPDYPGPRVGDTFIDSDTEKVWKHDGKNWIEAKKPEVMQEWIEKRANKAIEVVLTGGNVKGFIRSLVKEIKRVA